MAVVLGTNAGFVTVAPVADPFGSSFGVDGSARAHKHTTPAGLDKISEIGWYKNNVSNVGDYELGLYAHVVGTDLPGALLHSTVATTSGNAAGWLTQAVDWEVIPETIYWLAVQVDNVSGSINLDYTATGNRDSIDTGLAALPNPWVNAAASTRILAIYAVAEASIIFSELSGTISAVSNAVAGISANIQLAAVTAGVSSAVAFLSVTTRVSGSVGASSGATAFLSVATPLVGSVSGVSIATGNLGLPVSLAGSLTATSSATGRLRVTQRTQRTIGFYERTANQITTYFQGIADTNSFVVRFDNDPRDTPADDVWYLASVDFGVANQHELGTTTSFRVVGNFSVRSQNITGAGIGVLLENSDTITAAFRAINVDRIIFGIPRINNTGRIGDNFQINITCPFMIDKQPA